MMDERASGAATIHTIHTTHAYTTMHLLQRIPVIRKWFGKKRAVAAPSPHHVPHVQQVLTVDSPPESATAEMSEVHETVVEESPPGLTLQSPKRDSFRRWQQRASKMKSADVEPDSSTMDVLCKQAPLAADSLAAVAEINDDAGNVARCAFIKYAPSQAYCVIGNMADKIADKHVRVAEKEGAPLKLKLVTIESEKEDRRMLPLYVQSHWPSNARSAESHITDRLVENVMGRHNFELKKNITMDSFEQSSVWRDEAGFIVTDRHTFHLAEYKVADIKKTLLPSTDVNIVAYTDADFEATVEFDHAVCGADRDEYIKLLASGATLLIAKGASSVDGLIAAKGDRIMALYGETLEIAHALFLAYVKQAKCSKVTMFTIASQWDATPVSSRQVHRRHTRAIPSQLKWGKIYAINMGVHIV